MAGSIPASTVFTGRGAATHPPRVAARARLLCAIGVGRLPDGPPTALRHPALIAAVFPADDWRS
jgi:hypothetical protein